MGLPVIESRRLRLRPIGSEDLDDLHRLWIDPDVRRYLWDDLVISRERAAETVDALVASAREHGVGIWCVLGKAGSELQGFCGFRFLPDSPEIELLYGLDPAHWGKGLATEASRAALTWAFATLAPARIVAGADPPNRASFAVMERLEMRRLPEPIPALPGAIYYELRRDSFAPEPGVTW
jgi:ribosomal-protein-alanine N-acetyltransferase